jgi:hypothetical protein
MQPSRIPRFEIVSCKAIAVGGADVNGSDFMRKVALADMGWFRLKLRPMTIRMDADGFLPCIDDVWTVSEASKGGLRIENAGRTQHSWFLAADAIKEFRQDTFRFDIPGDCQGTLRLLGFLWLRGNQMGFEALSLPESERFSVAQFTAGVLPAGTLC